MTIEIIPPKAASARDKLLGAALRILREKGYNATAVDDLCAAAGVTKGAFFHHFKSKEDLAVAAANEWSRSTSAMFAAAAYHAHADPLDRVLAYIDLRADLIAGEISEFTCVAGTLAQEVFQTHPRIRDACRDSIFGHTGTLEADIAQALDLYRPDGGGVTARSLALHTQAVLQGGFILAKANDDPSIAADSIAHLRRYFEVLFASHAKPTETPA